LLGLSYLRLHGMDPGFDRRGVLLANIDLPRAGYPTAEKQGAFTARLLERLVALPGVTAAALTDSPPLHGSATYSPYAAADRPLPPADQRMMAIRRIVAPGFFRAVGLPLRRGRDFGPDDRPNTDAVAILNESAARLLFSGDDPLGRKIVLGLTTRTATVVGIVGDMRGESLTTPPKPEVFFSLGQRPRPSLVITLRTADTPSILAPSLRAVLRELDPDLPLIRPRLLSDDLAQSLADRRLPVQLLVVFGALALLLAAFGIYSVTSYTVALRRPEIATRLVLGAAPRTVRNLILGQGLRLSMLGIAVGFVLAVFAAGLLTKLLHGITAGHPPAYLGAGGFVLLVSTAACWLSARQAMRVDPVRLLREN
jgi:predicted permease